jgi:hypothetical protein
LVDVDVDEGVADAVGEAATVVSSTNPFARTARPTTTRPTMITMRPVLRFIAAHPTPPRVACGR